MASKQAETTFKIKKKRSSFKENKDLNIGKLL